jgi:four helix bundle protein
MIGKDFRTIKAWQLSDDLTVKIYEVTRKFPREEIYGITSQIRRSSYSVPANIAEGSNRGTGKEYLHFLYIARGSLAETEYFIHLSKRLGYIDEKTYEELNQLREETGATLNGFIKSKEKSVGIIPKFLALITSSLVIYGISHLKF